MSIIQLKNGSGTNLYPRTDTVLSADASTTFSSQVTTTINNFLKNYMPVGSIICSSKSTNPSSYYPGTTWVQVAPGRVLVGVGSSADASGNTDVRTKAASRSFGTYSVTLTVDNLPSHNHGIGGAGARFGSGSKTADAGGAAGTNFSTAPYGKNADEIEAINITEPVLAKYIWRRTA